VRPRGNPHQPRYDEWKHRYVPTHANYDIGFESTEQPSALKKTYRQPRHELEYSQGPAALNSSARDHVPHIAASHDEFILQGAAGSDELYHRSWRRLSERVNDMQGWY